MNDLAFTISSALIIAGIAFTALVFLAGITLGFGRSRRGLLDQMRDVFEMDTGVDEHVAPMETPRYIARNLWMPGSWREIARPPRRKGKDIMHIVMSSNYESPRIVIERY